MFGTLTVALILAAYVGLLFAAAVWMERQGPLARRMAADPTVYALSLAVYCTSWTFYGSVGKAAQSGMLFLAVYLGPLAVFALWDVVLGRFIRIRNAFRVTSLADFLSARFCKSQGLAALASIVALVGISPYVALQIKAVTTTFAIIVGNDPTNDWLGPAVTAFMFAFAVMFGARRLDPLERRHGIVAAVVVESAVKLLAFLAVGIFVTYGINDGFTGIFARASALDGAAPLGTGPEEASYALWTSYVVLSMAAFLFLPRQFHMAVIENPDVERIRRARWALPLYFLLITVFVVPIALDGLLSGLPREQADAFVLLAPLRHRAPWLALLVFLGGFSAATSMILVSSVTLANMTSNHLMLPIINRAPFLGFLKKRLLACRWAALAGVFGLAFAFERLFGESSMLVNIGLISFAAALQFAPAMLGGTFWRGANKIGAFLGLGSGFLIWTWCLLTPAAAKSGMLPAGLLTDGPLGLAFLRPEALFGMGVLDPLSHAVFWSLFFNVGLFVLGSLLFRQSQEERMTAEEFTAAGLSREPDESGALAEARRAAPSPRLEADVNLNEKCRILTTLIGHYLPASQAEAMVAECLGRLGLIGRKMVTVLDLAALRKLLERRLSGSLGVAAAHRALPGEAVFNSSETKLLSGVYARILARLSLSPEELVRKINFHQERETLIRRHSLELEERVRERTRDLAAKAAELEEANRRLLELDRLKSSFLSSVSHELRTPLTSIMGFTKLISRDFRRHLLPLAASSPQVGDKARRVLDNLDVIGQESDRLTRLINDLLDLAKIEEGRMDWRDAPVVVAELVERAVAAISGDLVRKPGLTLAAALAPGLPRLVVDRDRVLQVLVNLLNNAVKFTDAGTITVAAVLADSGGLRLSVRDSGPGVPEELREKIFDQFFQVVHGDTLLNKPRGTGLGLSICRQIVEHYGGRTWMEPAPGRGSEFFAEFPRERLVEAPAKPEETPPTGEDVPERDARERGLALIVDDDPHIRTYLRQILEDAGLDAAEAGSGEEALEKARRLRPDVATMDLMMPGMDGRTAIAAMRADPEMKRIPIVVVSVLPDRATTGADAAFDKPIDEERLVGAIKALLARDEKPLPAFTLLRSMGEGRDIHKRMALCPADVAYCDAPELADHIARGFTGTVIIRADAAADLDLEQLAALPGVQVVIMPEKGSR